MKDIKKKVKRRPVKTLDNNDVCSLEEVKVAGGSLVHGKPCLSIDSKLLFVVNDGRAHCYNTRSGELSHSLETAAPVVAVVVDEINPRHAYTCDCAGNVTLWDAVLGTSLKKLDLSAVTTDGSSVVGLLRPAGAEHPLVLVRPAGESETATLMRPTVGCRPAVVLSGVRRGLVDRWEVEWGDEGRLVAGITSPDTVLVRNIWQKKETQQKLYNTLRTDSERPFTCVACQRGAAVVAAGDASGRLLLWRRLLANQAPVRTVLHWHTLPLPSVAFSPEGTYLMSAGEECVLVFWHMHEEKPSFLPRLGLPIRHVSVSADNELIATAHADNVVRLVNAQRQLVRLVQGLTWGASIQPAAGLVLEPRSGGVLLNGAPGHLQLFSPHDAKDLYSVDIVQTNLLTRERTGALAQCDVTRVAVTSDGAWMATLEERDDGGRTPAERRLKFWAWDDATQGLVLNTSVDDPHDSVVTSLVFQPGPDAIAAPLAVTTGTDGALKYWSLVDDSDIYGSKQCWSCDAVGSHRRQPAGCASFSSDGVQLAVGFGSVVTLWKPDTNVMETTLSSVALRDDIRQVEFGREACSRLLVARTDSGLRVWSLDSLSLITRIDVRVTLLAADPCSEYMAAFTASSKVFVFRPSSSRPVHQAALGAEVTAAVFVPHRRPRPDLPDWERASQLYFLNSHQALHTLDRPAAAAVVTSDDVSDSPMTPADVSGSAVTPTPFSALQAQQRRSAVAAAPQHSQSQLTPALHKTLQMLEAPSHTLPPLTRMCSTFLESMLYARESEPEEPPQTEAGPAAAAEVEGSSDRRRAPSLETRLDHLLAADLSWLTV